MLALLTAVGDGLSDAGWVAISTIAAAMVAAVAAIGAAVVNGRSVRETGKVAREARDLSRPTGNGWTAELGRTLARIEGRVAGVESSQANLAHTITQHLEAHTSHDLSHAPDVSQPARRRRPPRDDA